MSGAVKTVPEDVTVEEVTLEISFPSGIESYAAPVVTVIDARVDVEVKSTLRPYFNSQPDDDIEYWDDVEVAYDLRIGDTPISEFPGVQVDHRNSRPKTSGWSICAAIFGSLFLIWLFT